MSNYVSKECHKVIGKSCAVLTILITRQFQVFKSYLMFLIRPSNKHSMREMEHFIPRAHLSREISYCFRQLLTPPPVREFSCNANVVHVRPTHDNCKSHKISTYLVDCIL